MAPTSRILILEDDELWLNSHKLRLMEAGFDCYATKDAKEAIKAAKTDPSVKFALIDEILYVNPFSIKEEEPELQRWQGHGVIREITAQRSDIQFIIISAVPQIESDKQEGDRHIFRQETAKLRRQQGVIDVVHKDDIKESPDESYGWIIDLLKRSQVNNKAEVITPKIIIGLGFSKETYEAIVEQMEIPKRQFLPISPLLKKGGSRILDEFWQRAEEKTVFLEMPGSKRLDHLKAIKPNSSAFQILSFLALQTERQANVLIQEKDYKHSSRQSKKTLSVEADVDAPERQDFAYGYGEDGRKGLRAGVQIEGKVEQSSPIKVAIHRLSQQLHKLNVGPARQLFNYEGDGYRPSFELGIVVYAVRPPKKT
ncbi:hypothetical protein ACQ4N7_26360 [Nodosilinea sp. AN01ver1]|uniref:hypothetical protein n=1 Tax=Nodosilinea sp. AN01ver1 TaxID=3423362 RepID=UPI003D321D1A